MTNRIKIKTGIGFDAHRFSNDRPLVLGGIGIPHSKGLAGHSDADVLIHAIIDSLSGAALGVDIGTLFPDTDESYKGINSGVLLKKVVSLIKKEGFKIGNVDAEIILEEPRLRNYINEMRRKLAGILDVDLDDVTIKATTTEKMGFCGRKEGIAALAVCLLTRN
ncbi:2-C-methyl-D-erythritol 2,4-cyclodiphosphate synthase [Flexistipes sinusarabici DSM 4947]|uniref:2-C-methyl-D-erythritol 2,4-cyclodiphosphate synthase n=1 Tax=Flexistipes sinusarabici (strain ATCC 49648 / DSM 4947 / MAS 10) TaxID=717231 RepID=F8E766_FLESM|nr:2-C-methyl-D-erythritol 2,4-cyclodiphosphate synthase [Flexistipes sinusarabici]AEI13781.1 2-C-methyl-D-erythritol 2,4-cyclodiphosphate synthase [Flexistipes sinusarabici DSM 4947]